MAKEIRSLEQQITSAVYKALQDRINEVIADEIEVATARVRRRLEDAAASICIATLAQVSMERMGSDLHIKIKADFGEKQNG